MVLYIHSELERRVDAFLNDFLAKNSEPLKDFLWSNKIGLLRALQMLKFLRENDGECLGDHPDWMRTIDAILFGMDQIPPPGSAAG